MPDKHEVGGSTPLEPTKDHFEKSGWQRAEYGTTVELRAQVESSTLSPPMSTLRLTKRMFIEN